MDTIPMSNDPRAADDDDETAFRKQDVPSSEADHMRMGLIPHRVRPAISISAHLLTIGLSLYCITVSFESYSLFSWHPVCMTIGSLALMAEAVMIMSCDNVLADRFGWHARVRAHWVLQALAAGFVLAGLAVIVSVKNRHSSPQHFASPHAILGLVYIVLMGLAAAGGLANLFSGSLKSYARPAVLKLGHAALGVATFAMGVVCLGTGLYTRSFANAAGYTSQVICTVLLVVAAVLTLENAAKSVYSRFHSLYRR